MAKLLACVRAVTQVVRREIAEWHRFYAWGCIIVAMGRK